MDQYRRTMKPRGKKDAIAPNEVRITSSGRVPRYITYAMKLFKEMNYTTVTLKAMGRAMSNTVIVAEILKRRIPGLHQVVEIASTGIVDEWEPIVDGLDSTEVKRNVSSIVIKLSTEPLEVEKPGYQEPLPEDQVVDGNSLRTRYRRRKKPRRQRKNTTPSEEPQDEGQQQQPQPRRRRRNRRYPRRPRHQQQQENQNQPQEPQEIQEPQQPQQIEGQEGISDSPSNRGRSRGRGGRSRGRGGRRRSRGGRRFFRGGRRYRGRRGGRGRAPRGAPRDTQPQEPQLQQQVVETPQPEAPIAINPSE